MLTRSSASKKWRSRLDPNNTFRIAISFQFLLVSASDSALQIRYRALDQTSTANARNIAVRYKGE